MILISLAFGYLVYIDKIMISWDNIFSRSIPLILLILGLPILSVRCILINWYRCRKFYKIYKNSLKERGVHFHKIVVEKEIFKINSQYTSADATIHPYPKSTNAIYIETDNYLLLFFSVSFWRIFQEVLNPFIFVKTGKEFYTKCKNINIIQEFEMSQREQNIVINFSSNRYGIKKIIIPPLGLK